MGVKSRERRYWDANVFLAYIKGERGRVEICEAIIQMARKDQCEIVTSTISLAEVVRTGHKGSVQITEANEKQIAGFFRNPWIVLVDFSPAQGELSRLLQWRAGLKVRDAIHAATAMSAKVDVFETYDPDFQKVRKSFPQFPPIREPVDKSRPLFDTIKPEKRP
jgi:predicted nucleic acid-binding protein